MGGEKGDGGTGSGVPTRVKGIINGGSRTISETSTPPNIHLGEILKHSFNTGISLSIPSIVHAAIQIMTTK